MARCAIPGWWMGSREMGQRRKTMKQLLHFIHGDAVAGVDLYRPAPG